MPVLVVLPHAHARVSLLAPPGYHTQTDSFPPIAKRYLPPPYSTPWAIHFLDASRDADILISIDSLVLLPS